MSSTRVYRRRQHGFTLVEVMVSITVGLILLSGVLSIFISNKTAYRLQESTNALDENARYALNQIQYHLRLGDHWGAVEALSDSTDENIDVDAALAALPIASKCTESMVISTTGFFGIEGDAASPLDCIPNADYQPNTDILIVRYAGPERVLPADIEAGEIYFHGRIGKVGRLFKGNAFASLPVEEVNGPGELAEYQFRTVIYFIRKCASQDRGTPNVCDPADDTTPSLARLVLQGTDLVQEDVVAGVEQLQARFGRLTPGAAPTTQYFDATTVTADNGWRQVVNVQVSLVLRSAEYDVTYSDERSFELYGEYDYEPDDADKHFSRKQFNFAVQIRNKTRG